MGSNRVGIRGQLVAWVLRSKKRLVYTVAGLASATLLLWVTPVPKQSPPHPSFLAGAASWGSGKAYATLDDGTVGWVFERSYTVAKDYGEVLPSATKELAAKGWKSLDVSGSVSENGGTVEEYRQAIFWRKASLFEVGAPSIVLHQSQADAETGPYTTVIVWEATYASNNLRALLLGVERILHPRIDPRELYQQMVDSQ